MKAIRIAIVVALLALSARPARADDPIPPTPVVDPLIEAQQRVAALEAQSAAAQSDADAAAARAAQAQAYAQQAQAAVEIARQQADALAVSQARAAAEEAARLAGAAISESEAAVTALDAARVKLDAARAEYASLALQYAGRASTAEEQLVVAGARIDTQREQIDWMRSAILLIAGVTLAALIWAMIAVMRILRQHPPAQPIQIVNEAPHSPTPTAEPGSLIVSLDDERADPAIEYLDAVLKGKHEHRAATTA